MMLAALGGVLAGLGVYALVRALLPGRPGLSARIQQIDAIRHRGQAPAHAPAGGRTSTVAGLREEIGNRVADFYAAQGWEQRSLRADLSILGRSWEAFLATKVLLAAGAVVFAPFVCAGLWELGMHLSLTVPLWLALLLGAITFVLPDLEVVRDAAKKRRDFRRVVGAYLDLVSMNLAGGRGLPEALMAASEVGDGWALQRIRNCLADARIVGMTQWEGLGRLGDDLAITELKDLGAALALVADDGAKIRASLSARAATMRHRELSEIEGKAGEQSQSMLVAQMLLAAGFLIFLSYPAASRIFEM